MLYDDAIECSGQLQVKPAASDCHVDHGGGAGRVGFCDEGSSDLLELVDRARARQDVCASAAVLRQHGDAARAGKPLLQFQDEAHRFALLYIRELVSEGRISISYISTDNNPPTSARNT